MSDQHPGCRLCLDSGENEETGPLIVPCRCSGSVQYVHRQCLDRWRATRHNANTFDMCEVCKFRYVIDDAPAPAVPNSKPRKWLHFAGVMFAEAARSTAKGGLVALLIGILAATFDHQNLHRSGPDRILHHFCETCSVMSYESMKTWAVISTALMFAGIGLVASTQLLCSQEQQLGPEEVGGGGGWDGVRANYHLHYHHRSCGSCHHRPPVHSDSILLPRGSGGGGDGGGCGNGCCSGGGGGSGGRDGCWLVLVILTAIVVVFAFIGVFVVLSAAIVRSTHARAHLSWNTKQAKTRPVHDFSHELEALRAFE